MTAYTVVALSDEELDAAIVAGETRLKERRKEWADELGRVSQFAARYAVQVRLRPPGTEEDAGTYHRAVAEVGRLSARAELAHDDLRIHTTERARRAKLAATPAKETR